MALVQTKVDNLESQQSEVKAKMDDMKHFGKHCNVQFVWLPEGVEPTTFLETWLKSVFGPETFSTMLCVEVSHCIPSRCPPPPQAFIAKFLNYKAPEIDKETRTLGP